MADGTSVSCGQGEKWSDAGCVLKAELAEFLGHGFEMKSGVKDSAAFFDPSGQSYGVGAKTAGGVGLGQEVGLTTGRAWAHGCP